MPDTGQKPAELRLPLPKIPAPIASYEGGANRQPAFPGRQRPAAGKWRLHQEQLGSILATEQGYEAAKLTGIIQLAVLKEAPGDLAKVKHIVKGNGYVNSDASFYDHPKVVNGFSDLIAVFGEEGKPARTALGVAALPMNMAVEVEE